MAIDPNNPPRGESVRETIVRSIREIQEREATMAQSVPPSTNVQALGDKAVLGMCELLGLLFALPFGDALYHGNSISGWHWFYLSIGLLFAGAGPMFPWIRARAWIPETASASLSRAALDARFWIATLLLIFVYMAAPEIYRRATGVNETAETSIAPRTASTEPSLAKRPEYLKNISFGGDYGNPSTIIEAIPTITTDRLRVYIDYSYYKAGWMQKVRAPIGEIKEPVAGVHVSLPIINYGQRPNGGGNDVWWGDPDLRYSISPPDLTDLLPATPFRARLVIVGPSGAEQHVYFMLIRVAKEPPVRGFGILREQNSDWKAEWEQETIK